MISAKIPNTARKKIYARDGYRCALCDSTSGLQIHHCVHRSRGGSNHPHNLIALCSNCHATVHGTRMYGNEMTPEDIEQAITEYLADMYAPSWNPYLRDPRESL